MLKALPSSYNRDLQEDKEALFDSVDTIKAALEVFTAMLPELKINRERMEAAANDPNLFATDLAEYLVKKGTPSGRRTRLSANSSRTRCKIKLRSTRFPFWKSKHSRHYSMSILQTCSTFAVHLRKEGRLAHRPSRTSLRRSSAGGRIWVGAIDLNRPPGVSSEPPPKHWLFCLPFIIFGRETERLGDHFERAAFCQSTY